MHYGFIGLGNLGAHLAANLLRGGFAVTIHDPNRTAAAQSARDPKRCPRREAHANSAPRHQRAGRETFMP